MPSLPYYIFKPMMRLTQRMQANFPMQDVNAYVRFRRRTDRMANLTMRLPRGVAVEHAAVGGVPGDWLIPAGAPTNLVMVFLHGGGIVFTWGSPHRRMVAYLVRFAGLRAFGVDYRLMPDYGYPAAHDDCFTVYRALIEQGQQVVLIGESSGGVLALATLLRIRTAGLPQPPLCVLISPTVDYGFKDQRIWQSDDPFVDARYVVEMHKHYVAANDPALPDFAPIYADLSGLAPLVVIAAEHDVLRCEAERLSDAAQRYNVNIELTICPHVWHGWHILVPQLPEATQVLKLLGDTIRQRVC
ncbi:MAG: alpha/beta hydrolase [Anaerolineae bacterium]|nr:alpha/beta hydrolase [Anaerolineae bacterium]